VFYGIDFLGGHGDGVGGYSRPPARAAVALLLHELRVCLIVQVAPVGTMMLKLDRFTVDIVSLR